MKRDPPEEFVVGEEKKQLDDSFTHVLTVYVKNGQCNVVCDGKPLTVTYAGVLQTIKDKAKREEQTQMAMYLNTNTPLMVMHSEVSAEVARQTIQYLGPTFPHRIVNWMRLDWTNDLPVEEVIAWHVAIDEHYKWPCRDCKALNSRLVDVCTECKAPRIEKKKLGDDKLGKFRSALPRSREAQATRQKLQGRLRMQYQKQLDVLDEGNDAVAGGALAKGKKDAAAVGPQLPAGAAGGV